MRYRTDKETSVARHRTYEQPDWIEDLRTWIKLRGKSVTVAAEHLGMSRRTAYRLIAEARAAGAW